MDQDDPIDVAMAARKAAGSAETVIKEPEAKKKKLQIPRPLNLKPVNPKEVLLTFISEQAEEEAKKAALSKEEKKSEKKVTYEDDPIGYANEKRMNAGGLSTQISKADAQKENFNIPSGLELRMQNSDMIDFKPAPVEERADSAPAEAQV